MTLRRYDVTDKSLAEKLLAPRLLVQALPLWADAMSSQNLHKGLQQTISSQHACSRERHI